MKATRKKETPVPGVGEEAPKCHLVTQRTQWPRPQEPPGKPRELQSTQETQVSICKKREKDIWEITIRKTSCGSPVKFENKF